MKLSEVIKNYREEHHVTMEKLAQDSGISKSYISMLENEKNPKTGNPIVPSIDTLKKLALGMHMDIDSLIKILDDIPVDISTSTNDYYNNQETAQIAQDLFDSREMRILFDAARGSKPSDLLMAAEMLRRFKEGNPDG